MRVGVLLLVIVLHGTHGGSRESAGGGVDVKYDEKRGKLLLPPARSDSELRPAPTLRAAYNAALWASYLVRPKSRSCGDRRRLRRRRSVVSISVSRGQNK
uniref:Putative secreted protein n=1 Tax=Anopheles marajoara TaxID=58244 RepID=A0A2M4C8U2_9DIPT